MDFVTETETNSGNKNSRFQRGFRFEKEEIT